MGYIGNRLADSYTSFAKQDFTTSATTNYVLDQAVTNANEIALFINFVRQEPTTAYTASGTALTLTSATTAGDDMYCIFLGKALQTVNPPAGSVGASQITDGSITSAKFASGAIANQSGFRNIIINGDMSIAQRGTSTASITSNTYALDRFLLSFSGSQGTWTVAQSSTVPSGQGFATSTKINCTTADASPAAGDRVFYSQRIEGQNLQYLKKGTSSAESTTLSFWVRSNKTGTYIANLFDNDNSRHISKSYTISSADTWEKKTITFAGDTTSAFDNDNARSLDLRLYLGAGTDYTSGTLATSWESATNANAAVGQVNLADSTSNEWYITGVQLEAGTTASDFEFLPVDVNLGRCLRYYYKYIEGSSKTIGIGSWWTASSIDTVAFFPISMRASPTVDATAGTNYYGINSNGVVYNITNSWSINRVNLTSAQMYVNPASTGTGGYAGLVTSNNASSYIAFNSEL